MEILFSGILSLLLIHEMDAIRAKEWQMFIGLKDMAEETAYKVFALIHLPLYLTVLHIFLYGGAMADHVLKLIVDIFLFGHAVVHYGFRKHKGNGFNSKFSKIIIYAMAMLALLHLCLLFAG